MDRQAELEQAFENLSQNELEAVLDALTLVAGRFEMDQANKGVYLKAPYGELIACGEMKCFAKPKRDERLIGPRLLLSDHKAFGVMRVGEPVRVDLSEFDELIGDHCIGRKERLQWWPEKEELWLYPIEEWRGYEGPIDVDLPPGVQGYVEDVKGGPGSGHHGHGGRPGQRGGSSPGGGGTGTISSPITSSDVVSQLGNPSPGMTRIYHATGGAPAFSFEGPDMSMGHVSGDEESRFQEYMDERNEEGFDVSAGWGTSDEILWRYGQWGTVIDVPSSAQFEGIDPGEIVYDIGHEDIEYPGAVLNLAAARNRGLTNEQIASEMEVARQNYGQVFVIDEDDALTEMKSFQSGLFVSLASTPLQAQKGFSNCTSIDPTEGLLIPISDGVGIWMKDTTVPLSVAFLDSDYKVLQIDSLTPNDETVHVGPEGTVWALEASPEWFKAVQMEAGDSVVGVKGGPGSGHHEHRGVPGKRGGSAPGGVGGRAINPEDFRRRGGEPLSGAEIKAVRESNAESVKMEIEQPSRPVYYLAKKDLSKVWLEGYEKVRASIQARKQELGKRYGLTMRDAAASAMKGFPEYLRGVGQGRYDAAAGIDYTKERPGSHFNLGYYRGFMNYERDVRGGLRIELPETRE